MKEEEMIDEMKIVIKSKMARHMLSSTISKAVNNKMPLDLNLKIDELVINALPDGTLAFWLSVNGSASKDKIFDLLKNKGGSL